MARTKDVVLPRCMDEILEDKGMIGGPGPVMPRKPKAGISM